MAAPRSPLDDPRYAISTDAMDTALAVVEDGIRYDLANTVARINDRELVALQQLAEAQASAQGAGNIAEQANAAAAAAIQAQGAAEAAARSIAAQVEQLRGEVARLTGERDALIQRANDARERLNRVNASLHTSLARLWSVGASFKPLDGADGGVHQGELAQEVADAAAELDASLGPMQRNEPGARLPAAIVVNASAASHGIALLRHALQSAGAAWLTTTGVGTNVGNFLARANASLVGAFFAGAPWVAETYNALRGARTAPADSAADEFVSLVARAHSFVAQYHAMLRLAYAPGLDAELNRVRLAMGYDVVLLGDAPRAGVGFGGGPPGGGGGPGTGGAPPPGGGDGSGRFTSAAAAAAQPAVFVSMPIAPGPAVFTSAPPVVMTQITGQRRPAEEVAAEDDPANLLRRLEYEPPPLPPGDEDMPQAAGGARPLLPGGVPADLYRNPEISGRGVTVFRENWRKARDNYCDNGYLCNPLDGASRTAAGKCAADPGRCAGDGRVLLAPSKPRLLPSRQRHSYAELRPEAVENTQTRRSRYADDGQGYA